MRNTLITLIASAGLSASASATVTWATQLQFVKTGDGPAGSQPGGTIIPAGGFLTLSVTGTYTFTVQMGSFNLLSSHPGDANRGLFNWLGGITASNLLP